MLLFKVFAPNGEPFEVQPHVAKTLVIQKGWKLDTSDVLPVVVPKPVPVVAPVPKPAPVVAPVSEAVPVPAAPVEMASDQSAASRLAGIEIIAPAHTRVVPPTITTAPKPTTTQGPGPL